MSHDSQVLLAVAFFSVAAGVMCGAVCYTYLQLNRKEFPLWALPLILLLVIFGWAMVAGVFIKTFLF